MQAHHCSPGLIIHTTEKHDLRRLLKPTWWLLLVRIDKAKLLPFFEVNIFAAKLWWGNADAPTCWSYHEVRLGYSQIHWYKESPSYIGIPPWETYTISSTNYCMVGHGNIMGVILNPDICNIYHGIHTIDLKDGR